MIYPKKNYSFSVFGAVKVVGVDPGVGKPISTGFNLNLIDVAKKYFTICLHFNS